MKVVVEIQTETERQLAKLLAPPCFFSKQCQEVDLFRIVHNMCSKGALAVCVREKKAEKVCLFEVGNGYGYLYRLGGDTAAKY